MDRMITTFDRSSEEKAPVLDWGGHENSKLSEDNSFSLTLGMLLIHPTSPRVTATTPKKEKKIQNIL